MDRFERARRLRDPQRREEDHRRRMTERLLPPDRLGADGPLTAPDDPA
jgi:hypothetical protein